MTHPWKSRGDKRTISFYHNPDSRIMEYLTDMRTLINMGILNAYSIAVQNDNQLPSPITLRKSLKNYGSLQHSGGNFNPPATR
jgi:hypothetical protein